MPLRFRAAGENGPSLVLVHGAGGSSVTWLRALPLLGRAARAIAPDLAGHGRSAGPAPRTVAEAREGLRSFVLELGLERPVLAGHSMGGAIALDYALAYSGEVSALVLCSTAAQLAVGREILDLLRQHFAAFHRFFAGLAFGPGVRTSDAEVAVRDLVSAAPGAVLADFVACDAFDVRAHLPELRVPTLVLCGLEDRLTPPSQSRELAASIAGARLALFPGAGHMLPWEEPSRVAAEIIALLTGNPSPAAGLEPLTPTRRA
jgi:pimeloyl-ACP methyl ester carboxylesterase